ncbi:class IV lanthionine synthetase LanL [Streptomyces lonarensis]|uniref:non-specific serine/threonine protein kinase n=1 Tax=Streptomyces lonarensis TaxID=700599 RepID=A0A7X6CXR8_9ACTN|nr:class IV lanthionine synthetase LanL [Streptomyces lonarensis]NJQ04482.1 protein kinase/lanthionine synthetase C family protein [Streptomyces lonarensis]
MQAFALDVLLDRLLADEDAEGWGTDEEEVWYRVTAPGAPDRVQGWKLHVAATRLSAPEVLHRSARVLIAGGCSFKFAKNTRIVEEMTGARYDRAQCGKFLTAYPRDDAHLRELAAALDEATAGLPGPAVLSDRPYRRGGLVSYRFGAFRGVPVLTDDGVFEGRLRTPDGGTAPDVRKPWFCPPSWAELPVPGAAARPPAVASPAPVLLAGRFVVREAIRHSARGGVYRAQDQRTGAEVVIKQARAHVHSGLPAEDARDGLRREEAALRALGAVCPAVVLSFEADGHLFLAQELVPGETLNSWVKDRHADDGGLSPARAVRLARKLTGLVAAVHAAGLVHQDISPNNLMVTPDEDVRLIDPEWASAPGAWTNRVYTPGYGAPEQVRAAGPGPGPGQAVDLFGLGAVLWFVATGVAPLLPPDDPDPRAPLERLEPVSALLAPDRPALVPLTPVIRGLLHAEPEERWSTERVMRALRGAVRDRADQGGATDPSRVAYESRLGRRLVADGLTHLVRAMAAPDATATPGMPERLWPSDDFGGRTDPCNVQHGAAGVLATFTRAAALSGDGPVGGADGGSLREVCARIAGWIDVRRETIPRLLPGLYFGRSGTAWALYDAGRLLGDERLTSHAAELGRAVPVRWPNPDVCHGAAGSGFAQLHLWRATGEQSFLDRAAECAQGLALAAERDGDRVMWEVPQTVDSQLAGIRYLGFAHGVAGIGAFMLAAAEATGEDRYRELALAAGLTLAAEAERGPWGARWRADVRDKHGETMLYHWCSGASGVGTFLVRLAASTGDADMLRLAEEAGAACHGARWNSTTAACHGLAGDGQFLLDLAEAVPGGPYRRWAGEMALALDARHALREGLRVIPDESGLGLRADAQTGMAGSLDFLLRLEYGGPRPWMADAPSVGAGSAGPAAAGSRA